MLVIGVRRPKLLTVQRQLLLLLLFLLFLLLLSRISLHF